MSTQANKGASGKQGLPRQPQLLQQLAAKAFGEGELRAGIQAAQI